MTFCASIPVASVTAANTTLAAAGFGPNNFSVPTRTTGSTGDATHASLSHGGTDAGFRAALIAIPGVMLNDTSFSAHIATRVLAWPKPETWYASPIMKGATRSYLGVTWESLVDYNVWTPPVAWREVVAVGYPAWVQPTGSSDAYAINAIVSFGGQNWKNTGSAANVWQPGVFGWVII